MTRSSRCRRERDRFPFGWPNAHLLTIPLAATTLRRRLPLGFKPAEKEYLVPIQARHICLVFRRFVSWEQDMTRLYVRALEARGIPHLLVGGRSFHNRGEIETLRAALAAIR